MIFRRVENIEERRLLESIVSLCDNVARHDEEKKKSLFFRAGAYAVMHKYCSLVHEMRDIPIKEVPGALYAYLFIERGIVARRCMKLVDTGPEWELDYQEGCLEAIDSLLRFLGLLLGYEKG